MTANVKLAERLEALRFDPRHHMGAGDIRLTLAQQDEIIAALRSPSPAQGMYSVEELYEYAEWLSAIGIPNCIKGEKLGIAAWKKARIDKPNG